MEDFKHLKGQEKSLHNRVRQKEEESKKEPTNPGGKLRFPTSRKLAHNGKINWD